MPSSDKPISIETDNNARDSSLVRNHGDDAMMIHGRVELLPNMGVDLHSPAMTYFRQGIWDALNDATDQGVWDENMGGDMDTPPQHNTMSYFYHSGHLFGRACSQRKWCGAHPTYRVPTDNVDFTYLIIRGDA